jgi:hypothetical protein
VPAIDPSALDTCARAVRDTLRSAREERGDSQHDVADRLNLTASALNRPETWAARVDLRRLASWCFAVGIEPIAAITMATDRVSWGMATAAGWVLVMNHDDVPTRGRQRVRQDVRLSGVGRQSCRRPPVRHRCAPRLERMHRWSRYMPPGTSAAVERSRRGERSMTMAVGWLARQPSTEATAAGLPDLIGQPR